MRLQRQFAWSGHSNAHIYEGLAGHMQESRHDWSAHQCLIKVKTLQEQWVSTTDHNCQLGAAHRTMPLMQQLSHILTPRETQQSPAMFTSTGSLPKPPPRPGSSDEQ